MSEQTTTQTEPEISAKEQAGRDVMGTLGIDPDGLIAGYSGLDERFGHSVVEFVFGEFVSRPELDLRTRQLATVAVLTALGGCEPQLETHLRATLRAGATRAEIIALIGHVLPYAGTPRVINAMNVAKRVLGAE
ncbi:carboxymuconolactone decarboxylase family protein [Actinokineospora inagensis]|uniref:carboxymuconolactone decarboxylase family protein n=1 Tax=Actinokineospora inagensis TaxID=103730 RepID=UPI0004190281|nr:carboxymuconolactone decarboxylase family protein [Actinokineospora inagensis]